MTKRRLRLLSLAALTCAILVYIQREYFKLKILSLSNGINSSSSPSLVNIAVIGSAGYIGSRLSLHLKQERNWNIFSYDRILSRNANYGISSADLQRYQIVIYLGGLTDYAVHGNHSDDIERENIDGIHNLAKRMSPRQVLIFGSTIHIDKKSGLISLDEESPVEPHLLDSHAASMMREEGILRSLSFSSPSSTPQIIGLRLSTVIGLSYSRWTDLLPTKLVCQAFLDGKIHVTQLDTIHGFLWMGDLIRAVTILIKHSKKARRFDIFHLQSFSSSISKITNTIAFRSGAYIHSFGHSLNNSAGFSLNTIKFRTTFNFAFKDNQDQIISHLIDDVPQMCLSVQSRIDSGSVPCLVCGSRLMHSVLDLHAEPFSDDYNTKRKKTEKCEKFPLRLVRCPKCHHTQLSSLVNCTYLFSHYSYTANTSQNRKLQFEWLAGKIIEESENTNGTVLGISCKDDSDLSQFYKRGWKTVAIDSIKNLSELPRSREHTIYNDVWRVNSSSYLSFPEYLDAIIVQDELSRVDNPVHFLRSCAAIMHSTTKLYIQLSQCNMYINGQLDTIYHEHVSFFTAHSLKKLAELVGLHIVHYETIPFYEDSCLITFQRVITSKFSISARKEASAPLFTMALRKEHGLGMTDAWFYVQYEAQVHAMRQWISRQLTFFHTQGHIIIAYGAATKSILLLHYLLDVADRSWNISYVVDDILLTKHMYCPGTLIPIYNISKLQNYSSTDSLTIVILEWRMWNDISDKIYKETNEKKMKNVYILVPYPQQQLIRFNSNSNLIITQNSYKPLPWPIMFPSSRRSVLLISHFFNEELLLPFWIRHHAPMFDIAILIDYNSTDRSLNIIRNEAPPTWKIVSSRNPQFDARLVDLELMDYEKMYPNTWKIALNTPEFLVHFNLREMLAKAELSSDVMAFRFRSMIMTGNDSMPLCKFTSLLKQRSQYAYSSNSQDEKHGITFYSRFIHRYSYGRYRIGRHSIERDWQWAPTGFIAKYQYTPWPDITKRKLQIRQRIPNTDFAVGFGFHHNVDIEKLEKNKHVYERMPQNDLRNFFAASAELSMAHRLWREIMDY